MSTPAGCKPHYTLMCCDPIRIPAYEDPETHIIGSAYYATEPFEVDGIVYDPRHGFRGVMVRPMIELLIR